MNARQFFLFEACVCIGFGMCSIKFKYYGFTAFFLTTCILDFIEALLL